MRTERILLAWLRTHLAMRKSASGLAKSRAAKWRALQPSLLRTPALNEHAGKPLADIPVTDISDVRRDYGRWNSLGLSHTQCTSLAGAAERGEDTGEIVAGWSTGTGGGSRGLFLTNAAERADYIGQSLARLLPASAIFKPQRIALHLRASSALYADVGRRRMEFAHFPLDHDIAETEAALRSFDPTILIAPPHRLLSLAKRGCDLPSLMHLFYGSEPMSRAECAFVEQRLGRLPRPIYQATEGFLGSACEQGRLHLNDHSLEIELEPVAGTGGFRPVITDLHRRSQPVVRFRGDDFLELDERTTCPCGFAGRTILPVMGRVSDLWILSTGTVAPRAIVATIEKILGGALAWQAQASSTAAILRTASDCPPDLREDAALGLQRLTGLPVSSSGNLAEWHGPKRRKVIWSDG